MLSITPENVSNRIAFADLMPPILRNLKHNSDRDTRNFRILKDYIKTLRYLVDTFSYNFFSLTQR